MRQKVLAESLSKVYEITKHGAETMLRESVVNFVKHPLRRSKDDKDLVWALKDVSFSVEEGEIVGIIGQNGAGKSTLLKVLSRITYPTSGRMLMRGRVASLLEVGTGFHDELTGLENIYLNGSILGMTKSEIRSKLDAIIAFADVERFTDTPIKRYSSGMRLRLGFAVAAHLDADILIVDEVLAVGDVGFQKKCLKTMDGLRREGKTVLFVSHNMAAVENLCNRAIWIDRGRIREDSVSVREVIAKYMSSFGQTERNGCDLRLVDGPRMGNGQVRYTKIEFLSPDGEPLDFVQSGDKLVVRLHYHSEKGVSNNVIFGFRIFTDLGTLVTDVSNGCTGDEISYLPMGNGHVDLKIDFLNLMPGRYHFSLWLHNDTGVIFDCLEYCVALNIEVSNFYGSGKGIDSRNGIIFLPFKVDLDGLKIPTPA